MATRALLVAAVGEHAEHGAARGEPLDGPVRPHEHRRVVAGVAYVSVPSVRIGDAVEEADEPAFGDVAAEDAIDLLAQLQRLRRVGGEGAHRGLQVRHQQRGRDALADDVGDGQREALAAERDRVEAVAADA